MQTFRYFKYSFWFSLFIFHNTLHAQIASEEISKLDYEKIYAHCLDGNVKSALPLLEIDNSQLSKKDIQFKKEFENRFKGIADSSEYLTGKKSKIQGLHSIFSDYWRQALLEPNETHDQLLGRRAVQFLKNNYSDVKNKNITRDSIGYFLSQFIKSKGYYTLESLDKTENIYDLLVWESERDTTYSFSLKKEKVKVKVVFMYNFVTLGWQEYATLGKYFPGGWAKDGAIYCVRESYDIESENFKISYLAHEGRHFLDKNTFPNLQSSDLEYRAKLSELSLAKNTLYDIIQNFASKANEQSENPHPLANYWVIHNLSKELLNVDFEKNLINWKKISPKKINNAAYRLLKNNTRALQQKGVNVTSIIKT